MITLKTGVPGSGKSLSMVDELLKNASSDTPRPVFCNITDLALPHIPLQNWETTTKREDGVMYTIDWRQCPPESIIIIDEAFLYGYHATSASAPVPDYIRDLATHRKDYSVDIWFIAQHPKLLHPALRRQIGKHEHYRRLFGWSRAVVYEWDSCQDNLGNTKTAVKKSFRYPKKAYKAYKSADVHTKQKFSLPFWIWIFPAIALLAVWAIPTGYKVMSGAMSGKGLQGIHQDKKPAVEAATAPQTPFPEGFVPLGTNPVPSAPAPAPVAPSAPVAPMAAPLAPQKPAYAGCIAVKDRCSCLDQSGQLVDVDHGLCLEKTGSGRGQPVQFAGAETPRVSVASEMQGPQLGSLGKEQAPSKALGQPQQFPASTSLARQ